MKDSFLIADTMTRFLEDHKLQDVVLIDLKDKYNIADYMIIATGTSSRQIGAVAELLVMELKSLGIKDTIVEGDATCDWVLLDSCGVIVHLFKEEMRAFYNLEALWNPEAIKQ